MKALRAIPRCRAFYWKCFKEVSGIAPVDYHTICNALDLRGCSYTEELTRLRKGLAKAGYKKEVSAADDLYIARYRGYPSQEAWESRWQDYHDTYGDEAYPNSAL